MQRRTPPPNGIQRVRVRLGLEEALGTEAVGLGEQRGVEVRQSAPRARGARRPGSCSRRARRARAWSRAENADHRPLALDLADERVARYGRPRELRRQPLDQVGVPAQPLDRPRERRGGRLVARPTSSVSSWSRISASVICGRGASMRAGTSSRGSSRRARSISASSRASTSARAREEAAPRAQAPEVALERAARPSPSSSRGPRTAAAPARARRPRRPARRTPRAGSRAG